MPPWSLISPASRGIGFALARRVLQTTHTPVIATARKDLDRTKEELLDGLGVDEGRLTVLKLDVLDEASIADAAAACKEKFSDGSSQLQLALMVPGILFPEKSPAQINADDALLTFRTNTLGPMLMLKHFSSFFPKKTSAVSKDQDDMEGLPDAATIVIMSARVGSISDNRLGGWYSYRASKAGVNQVVKTFDNHLRTASTNNAMAVALHPGTVKTGLSKDFWSNVKKEKLFERDWVAERLIDVIKQVGIEGRGKCWDWDGKEPPIWADFTRITESPEPLEATNTSDQRTLNKRLKQSEPRTTIAPKGRPTDDHQDSPAFVLSPIADWEHDTEEQSVQQNLIQPSVAPGRDTYFNYIKKPVHLVARIKPKSHLASSKTQSVSPLPEHETQGSEKQASGNITSTGRSSPRKSAVDIVSNRWSNFSGDYTHLYKDSSSENRDTRENTPTAGPSSSPATAQQGQQRVDGPSPAQSAAPLIVPPPRPRNQFDRFAVPVDKPISKWLYALPHRYPMPVEKCQDQTIPSIHLPIVNILPVPEKHWHSSVHSARTRKSHLYWARRAVEPPAPAPRGTTGYEVPTLRKAPRVPKGSMERFKRQFRKYWIRKKYAWKQYQRDILVEEQIQEDGTRPQPDGTDTPPADDPDPDNAPPQPQEAPNFSKKLRKENPRDNSSSYLEPPPRSPHRPLVLNGFARCEPELDVFGFLEPIFEMPKEDDSDDSAYDSDSTPSMHSIIPEITVEDWNDTSNPRPSLDDKTGGPACVRPQQVNVNRSHLHVTKPAMTPRRQRIHKLLLQRQKNAEINLALKHPLKRVDSVTAPASALRGGHDVSHYRSDE
ncbi:hypothetical protein PtrCC142_002912 [Pyrenophora tritici-repentis]|nr:FabG Dehydrogenase with different specificities related to short-chain alcohol dehydrogenase [Pyrenophora tritici-repentis]KAI1604915.1 hypothetical protein PtrCC142_002912 [Pyrenophora tritici-repentis]